MKRRIAAILAADIAGYSRLVAEDEEETLRRLTEYQRLFKDMINEAGGRVFKTAGDSVLAEFPSAVDALRCAVTVQESLRIRNQAYPASRQMAYRVGMTIGDIVDQDGDLLGDGVNIAARLETLAQPGGICVSKAVYDAVISKLSVAFNDMGMQTVKNIPVPIHAFSVAQEQRVSNTTATGMTGNLSPNAILAGLAVALASAALVWVIQRPADHADPARKDVATQEASATLPPANQATETPNEVSPPTAVASGTPPSVGASGQDDVAATAPDAPASSETKPATAPAPASVVAPVKEDIASASRLRPIRWSTCRSDDTSAALQACGALAADMAMEGESRAEAQRRLGYAQRKSGDIDGAIKSLTASIETSPTTVAHNDRGTAYVLKGDYAGALSDYDAAIKIDGKNGEAWNNRAWTYYKLGQARNALDDANMAVKLIGNEAYVWDTRGHIHEAMGSRKSAESDFLKAVSIDPELKTSQVALKRLTGR